MATKAGAQVLILDDGMQHRQLARDLEVVLMDIEDPFGKGYHLPRGYLREDLTGLSRAHLIILNHVRNQEQFLSVKDQLAKFTKASVIGCQMKVTQIVDLKGNEIPSLEGKNVGLFCAIAKPEKFKETVLNQGALILGEYFISDHQPFQPSKLEKFAISCKQKGIEMLLCTEKDGVKFADFLELSLPVFCVKVKLHLTEGDLEWKAFIENAKKDILRRI
jgi:tetraacyldisaccharide 4'-kinase